MYNGTPCHVNTTVRDSGRGMDLNSTERETVGLCISLEAISDIVNHALLDVRESTRTPGESMVYFKDYVHRSLFIIRFLDFAKEVGDSKLTGISGSCVNVLDKVCQTRSYNVDESIRELETSIAELKKWLNEKPPIKLWLPTLQIDAKIEVPRIELLKIAGNHSKHNVSRLTGVSREIHKILSEHSYDVPIELIPLALEDFQEHLSENYFIYYGTWMSELLNNIRWGIQRYLEPTYIKSHKKGDDGYSYRFEYPDEIKNEISQQWFWRLMNHIRSGPYVKRFSSLDGFKEMSSLEWDE